MNESEADLSQSDREIVLTRLFDAPRELVFQVWTEPRHIEKWWGPRGFTTTTRNMDFRPGGVWRLVMHGPDGVDYHNRIVYLEVVKPERIVYKHEGDDDCESVKFQVTVTFEKLGNKTRLTMRMQFPSAATREHVIEKYGALEGAKQTLARLAEHVATLRTECRVHFTRVYAVPRSLVFKAWTDPKHMARWWGPSGFTNPVCEMDVRPGGLMRIVMRGPDGAEHPMSAVFREIAEPERLVFDMFPEDVHGNRLAEATAVATFVEHNGKTTLTVDATFFGLCDSAAQMAAGMEAGWSQSLDRLAALIAQE